MNRWLLYNIERCDWQELKMDGRGVRWPLFHLCHLKFPNIVFPRNNVTGKCLYVSQESNILCKRRIWETYEKWKAHEFAWKQAEVKTRNMAMSTSCNRGYFILPPVFQTFFLKPGVMGKSSQTRKYVSPSQNSPGWSSSKWPNSRTSCLAWLHPWQWDSAHDNQRYELWSL